MNGEKEVVLTAEQAEMLRKTLAGIGACVGTTIGHQTVFVPARLVSEARQALALLPEPVDGDLVEARKILSDAYEAGGQLYLAARQTVMAGNADDEPRLQAVLLGIRRGRALERGGAA